MRSLAPVLLALASLAAAGCFGMCGYSPESATWVEPGLFDWLEENGEALEGARRNDGGAGLAFDGEVDGLQPTALLSLTWRQGQASASHEPTLRLDLGGRVAAYHATSEAAARVAFREFAGNVSAANATELAAAEDAFLASREPSGAVGREEDGTSLEVPAYHYSAQLPGPYRFEALANETAASFGDLRPDPYRQPGKLNAQGAGYVWEFALAWWRVPVDGGHIDLDMLDMVQVRGVFAEGDSDADVERKSRRAFVDAGLPEPGMEGLTHGGSIC